MINTSRIGHDQNILNLADWAIYLRISIKLKLCRAETKLKLSKLLNLSRKHDKFEMEDFSADTVLSGPPGSHWWGSFPRWPSWISRLESCISWKIARITSNGKGSISNWHFWSKPCTSWQFWTVDISQNRLDYWYRGIEKWQIFSGYGFQWGVGLPLSLLWLLIVQTIPTLPGGKASNLNMDPVLEKLWITKLSP